MIPQPSHTPAWVGEVSAEPIAPPLTEGGRVRGFQSWETALDFLLRGHDLARSQADYIDGRKHGTRAIDTSRAHDFATQEPDAARTMLAALVAGHEGYAPLLDAFDAWRTPDRDPWEPAPEPDKPKKRGKDKEIPVLKQEEIDAIRKAIGRGITQKRNRAMLSLLEVTGLRVGEVLLLRRDSIEYEGRIALVTVPCADGAKTGTRVVPFVAYDEQGKPARVMRDLAAWEKVRYPGERLFTTRTGEPVAASAVRRFVTRYADRAGITRVHVTPHVYRHTYATRKVREGWEPDAVRKALGHRNLTTTMRYFWTDTSRLVELLLKGGE